MLYTLDFMAEFVPDQDMPTQTFTNMTAATWHCYRTGTTVDSLLPLTPEQWARVLDSTDLISYEWWLQLHLAAGQVPVFPFIETLDALTEADEQDEVCIWVDDVMDAHEIALLMQSEEDPAVLVPLERPWVDEM
ncbi:hypothetical protein BC828DRAFT_401778 [Blastocladiella britannica]|nr:hypothetical protein BC828DRAFT_401778 [Blastocladiella britannica]